MTDHTTDLSLPTTLKLGHREYTLEAVEGERANELDIWGDIKFDKGALRFDASLPPNMVAEVILHELMHYLFKKYGIPRKHEEKYVTQLGEGLTEIFDDNPWLAQFIAEVFKK